MIFILEISAQAEKDFSYHKKSGSSLFQISLSKEE